MSVCVRVSVRVRVRLNGRCEAHRLWIYSVVIIRQRMKTVDFFFLKPTFEQAVVIH